MTKIDQIIDTDDDDNDTKEYNNTIIQEHQCNIENTLVTNGVDLSDMQIIVPISSKTGYGLNDLLDDIDMQSQLMDLRSSPMPSSMSSSNGNKKKKNTSFQHVEGIMLEGRMEKGLGAVVRDGYTLKVGSTALRYDSGVHRKVDRLIDVDNKNVKTHAKPSQPVRTIGLKSIPMSGETIITAQNEEIAKTH